MDALEAIFTRRSIRKYTPRQVADDTVILLLKAGMAAPTCVNNLDWQFGHLSEFRAACHSRQRHTHC